jgi:hypothetical protein
MGDENITHEAGQLYTDANASWSDHVDGSGMVTASGSVNINTPGSYALNYDYTDSNGNVASTVTRTVTVVDTTAPVLTIMGDGNITHEAGQLYTDANASWSDHVDGSGMVTASGSVNINTPGSYVLSYDYTDSNGNAASTVTRTVTVVDTTAPVLTITGDQNISHEVGLAYTDVNASWSDHVDGIGMVAASGSVGVNTPGSYVLSYDYTDSNGNAASTVTRTVTVVDTTRPEITLNGSANLAHEAGLPYEDANATWADLIDGNGIIIATGTVNINVTGTYLLSYNYTDSSGNAAVTKFRTVAIFDSDIPVITLNGDQNITHSAGQDYHDENATWVDAVDGNGTVVATGIVNVNTLGSFTLSYDYTDSNGNVASTVTRTVTVVDTTAPVLTITGGQNISHEAGLVYSDANATWSDFIDGSGMVTASGGLDINTPGDYVLSYNYTDSNGNAASTVTRTVTVVDTTAPVLTITGDQNISHEAGLAYTDDNATWSDFIDGSGTVTAIGSVDTNVLGSYVLNYDYTDSNGNAASTVTRTVIVVDTTRPEITLNGSANLAHQVGLAYEDDNASWTDFIDGSGTINATGTVNTDVIGIYLLSYDYTDSSGNTAISKSRTVTIFDSDNPIILLNGDQNITHSAGQDYYDENATWVDAVDGNGTVVATGNVDTNTPGSYTLNYNFTDSGGNAAIPIARTVTVVDTTAPVITLNGASSITQEVGVAYTDTNATWSDFVDGNGTVTATGNVDTNTPGSYTLNYNFTDSGGNAAIPIARTVTVVDTTAPVITLNGASSITQEVGVAYTDTNATWSDFVDGNGTVTGTGNVDTNTPGSYTLNYNFTDSGGNEAITIARTVTVMDTTAPVITLNGAYSITQEVGFTYTDTNAIWSDFVDGNGTISATGSVNINVTGTYELTYNYTDSSGNAANTVVRQVIIEGSDESDDTELTSFQDDLTDAIPVEGIEGWWESRWMGYYSSETYPWIYHQNLGWIFVSIDSSQGLWFYHSRLGWLWTNSYHYPYLYLVQRDQWIYLNQAKAITTVYDYDQEEWFEPDTPIGVLSGDAIHVGGEVEGYGYYYRWDKVKLIAKPHTGFNFAVWSGDKFSLNPGIEFEAIKDTKIDASFIRIPSSNSSAQEVMKSAMDALNKMNHLNEDQKKRSLAELLIYGTSPTSGLKLK